MISGRVALSIDGCLDTHRKLAECREGEMIGLETAVGSYNKYRMHAQAANTVLVGVLTRQVWRGVHSCRLIVGQDWQDLQRDKNPVCTLVMREVCVCCFYQSMSERWLGRSMKDWHGSSNCWQRPASSIRRCQLIHSQSPLVRSASSTELLRHRQLF